MSFINSVDASKLLIYIFCWIRDVCGILQTALILYWAKLRTAVKMDFHSSPRSVLASIGKIIYTVAGSIWKRREYMRKRRRGNEEK